MKIRQLLHLLFVLLSSALMGQSSSYLLDIEGNGTIDDTLYVADEQIELSNSRIGTFPNFHKAAILKLYDENIFGKGSSKVERIGMYSHIWTGVIDDPLITFNNADGNSVASMYITPSIGGAIILKDYEENTRVTLRAMETEGDGGQIQLFNADDEATIEIDGDSNDDGALIKVMNQDGDNRVTIVGSRTTDGTDDGGAIYLYNSDGDRKMTLDANTGGDSRLTTDEIQLNGGSDFAEAFDILNTSDEFLPEPGMLVSIDPSSTGRLQLTSTPFDYKVAGVISGANGIKPGLYMGQKGTIADGEYPIALAGRVYVRTTLEGGEIQPGDMLTSSSKRGYAMRANRNDDRSRGAIIGKALTSRDSKTGYVLVLVGLQ